MSKKIDLSQAPAFIERELLHVLDAKIAPHLGADAALVLPLVKRGVQLLLQFIAKRGHKDAEQLLDFLAAHPLEKV